MWNDVTGPPPHPIFTPHGRPARAMIGYEGKPTGMKDRAGRYAASRCGHACEGYGDRTSAEGCGRLAARSPDATAGRLAAVAQETGGVALQADLADPMGPADLATAALRGAGHVDLLVSNACIGWAGPISEITAAKVGELIAVNLTAPIHLTRLLPSASRYRLQAAAALARTSSTLVVLVG